MRFIRFEAGDTWAGEGGDAKKGADVISYLKGLHEGPTVVLTFLVVGLCSKLEKWFASWLWVGQKFNKILGF